MQFALCTMSLGTTTHLRLIQGFTPDENVLVASVNGKRGVPKETRWQVATSGNINNVNTVNDLAKGGPSSGFQGLASALQQKAQPSKTSPIRRTVRRSPWNR